MNGVVILYKTTVTVRRISSDEMINNYYNKEKFIELCKACSNYEVLWSCPPFDFDPEAYIKNYKSAYIIGTKIIYSQDVIDYANTKEKVAECTRKSLYVLRGILLKILWQLEKEYPNSLGISAGGCEICSCCSRADDLPCRHSDRMRYSLESLGVDLGALASHLLGIELKWSDGGYLPEYLTLINAFMTNLDLQSLERKITDMVANELL